MLDSPRSALAHSEDGERKRRRAVLASRGVLTSGVGGGDGTCEAHEDEDNDWQARAWEVRAWEARHEGQCTDYDFEGDGWQARYWHTWGDGVEEALHAEHGRRWDDVRQRSGWHRWGDEAWEASHTDHAKIWDNVGASRHMWDDRARAADSKGNDGARQDWQSNAWLDDGSEVDDGSDASYASSWLDTWHASTCEDSSTLAGDGVVAEHSTEHAPHRPRHVQLRPRSAVGADGPKQVDVHVAFVLDKSGSMRKADVDGAKSRMDVVFQAVTDFLDNSARAVVGLQQSMSFAYSLVLFNDSRETPLQMASLFSDREKLVLARTAVHPCGGTRYGEGLQGLSEVVDHAKSMASPGDSSCGGQATLQHVAIFLSDGRPCDHVAESVLKELIARLGPNEFKLHTVGFGLETTAVDSHGLARLAKLGSGSFFDNTKVDLTSCKPAVGPQGTLQGLAPPTPTCDSPHVSAATLCKMPPPPSTILRPRAAKQIVPKTPVSGAARLSAASLSATFSKLANTVVNTVHASTMARTSAVQDAPGANIPGLDLAPIYESMAEAKTEEWKALRWIENRGVLKLEGAAGDTFVVDTEEVLDIDADETFCTRSIRLCTAPFARGGMRLVHQMWDTTNGSEQLVAKRPVIHTVSQHAIPKSR